MENLTKLNQRRWAIQLALITGLALLFLAALLWGLRGVTLVRADPGPRHAGDTISTDTVDNSNPAASAATVRYVAITGYDIGADEFVGTPVSPGPRYVDGATGSDTTDCTDPAAPCETIGYALTQAWSEDVIHITEGTYTETLDIVISVTLKGGYTISGTLWLPHTGETIVDANGADDSVIAIYPYTAVTIDDLTVEGADHTGVGGYGGVSIDRSDVVISGTVVRDNHAGGNGGGIYIQDDGESASLILVNSSILNNSSDGEGGGIATSGWPTLTLQSVLVEGNTSNGSGGGLQVGIVTITNSQIVSNTAGGFGGGISAHVIHISNSEISDNEANGPGTIFGGGISCRGQLVMQDCTVSNNRAVGGGESIGGGIDAEGAEATIVNTIVSGNAAQHNAGVGLWNSALTMTNSLIISNTGTGLSGNPITGTIVNVTVADNAGEGMHVGGAIAISNSVMWGNGGNDYVCDGGCTLAYSDVGNGDITGAGNISKDPLFADAASGDYHLGVGSPCVDRGTPASAPPADIEGTPRDAAPDMGAYEWTGFRIFLPLTLRGFGP
jgi:predicted outer membrane repeat protein